MSKLILPSTILAAILAFVLGWFFGPLLAPFQIVGDLFLNLLKLLVIPLVIASLISGIVSLGDIRKLGLFGARTFVYYLATMSVAVGIGIVLSNFIQPGVGGPAAGDPSSAGALPSVSGSDFLTSLIPENLFAALSGANLLPLILFSLFFAAVLTTIGDKAKPLVNFFESLNAVIMKMVHLVMYFTPIGVFGLIAGRLAKIGGGEAFQAELVSLGTYVITVLSGLAIHALIILPLVYWIFRRRNPFRFGTRMLEALTVAFSTASSSATLPVTYDCVEKKNNVSPKSSRFVLPIGATVNMDGTALYEAVAAMYIAQLYGIDLSVGQQLILFFVASVAAIGAAGIPEAGLVTMVMVFTILGLPLEGIGLLLAIDWFLDRCRTTVNVWGDAVGAGLLERWTK